MANALRRPHYPLAALLWLPCLSLLCACGPRAEQPLQGYVEGEYVRVAAPFAGTLQQLSVQRGGEVTAGAPLFTLERENEIAGRRQAEPQADWRLSQRAVTAPANGRVSDTYFVVGDWVPAGAVVASLLPPGNIKIRFFVAEPRLGALRPGQVVRFSCDGCGDAMSAIISFIADRAEFTPPVLYSKENRTKLVYLVEAKPETSVAIRLNPGQPIDVTLPGA